MTDQLSGIGAAKAIGNPFGTFIEWMAGLLPEGPASILFYVVAGLCVLAARVVYKYYLGVLAQGAAPEGSIERQDYDKLRASLAGGNLAARLYAKWLTVFLDRIEWLFGDVGMADRTLFPHAFGLKKPAPLWTAHALDRCLLLALIYPVVTIFVTWVISGHVGPAEAALGLNPDISIWLRGLSAGAIAFATFANWRWYESIAWWLRFGKGRWKPLVWIAVSTTAAAVASLVAGFIAFALPLAASLGTFVIVRAPVFLSGSVTVAAIVVGFGGIGLNDAAAFSVVIAVPVVLGIVVAMRYGRRLAIKTGRQIVFLSLFFPAMILVCFGATALLSPSDNWNIIGPQLLFLSLLTLLNAPFDWASLGLTRALLHRGLELGGWWPYFLALVDAALAGVIIALLALAMVIGVQAFDELAAHGGGKPVLPLDALFDGIAEKPAAPEYWWAYALLLSSMIPSLVNLTIGGMAFTRGIPSLARLLLQWVPEGKAVPDYRRPLAAIGLTTQMFAGVGLGIAAQAFLVWGLIFHVMPWVGLDLLDMARAVAAFDVPGRIGMLFAGTA
ncbi:hypothetical protein QEV83_05805 [Methylocapsa sp. D3K7]|uniref:hypothetical protein n=1 Tax=Methylocapsa sp. D3K7 TaxID=3041435 RepID=UPI00244EC8D5|nr:hypothetical protein [Methylocapsa sp. D3K7]WGJ15773.1 hypothetical protein QEV83_05805 [Methylocapsa sp. D3K7]